MSSLYSISSRYSASPPESHYAYSVTSSQRDHAILHHPQPIVIPYIEWDPDRGGWWHGNQKLHRFRPRKYWTRPHDGRRSGTIGRIRDLLMGKGADVFVTFSGDPRTLLRDRPQRWQWTNDRATLREILEKRALDKGHRVQDELVPGNMPWTREREKKSRYNFRTRRFERPCLC